MQSETRLSPHSRTNRCPCRSSASAGSHWRPAPQRRAPRPPATDRPRPAMSSLPSADSVLATVRDALRAWPAWQASRLMAPVLADSQQRPPVALMLAATAASRWGGWREVVRLLEGQRWVDSLLRRPGAAAAGPRRRSSAAPTFALRPRARAPVSNSTPSRRASGCCSWPRRSSGSMPGTAPPRPTRGPPSGCRASPTGSASAPPRSPTTAPDGPGSTRVIGDPLGARPRSRWSEAAAHAAAPAISTVRRSATPAPRRAAHRAAAPARAEPRQRPARGGPARSARGARGRAPEPGRGAGRDRPARQRLRAAHAGRGARGRRGRPTAGRPGAAARPTGSSAPSRRGSAPRDDRFAYATALTRLGRNADAARQFAWCRAAKRARRLRGVPARPRAGPRRPAGAGPARRSSACCDSSRATPPPPPSALFLLGDLASDDRADPRARELLPEGRRPLPEQPVRADGRASAPR